MYLSRGGGRCRGRPTDDVFSIMLSCLETVVDSTSPGCCRWRCSCLMSDVELNVIFYTTSLTTDLILLCLLKLPRTCGCSFVLPTWPCEGCRCMQGKWAWTGPLCERWCDRSRYVMIGWTCPYYCRFQGQFGFRQTVRLNVLVFPLSTWPLWRLLLHARPVGLDGPLGERWRCRSRHSAESYLFAEKF